MPKTDTKPLISICIPTYNNAQYIDKTIQSILNQTYSTVEVIIGNNASIDNTKKIVSSFKDKRIRYYYNKENIGAAKNFNKCMREAKGEIIALYHSDDIYDQMIVEKQSRLLLSNPEIGAVFALDSLIDEEGVGLGKGVSLPRQLRNRSIYDFAEIYTALLVEGYNFMVCPTFMVKRSVLDEVGAFDETQKYGDWIGGAGDTELWLRIVEKHKIGIVNERLIFRRISTQSGSGQYEPKHTTRSNHLVVLSAFLTSPNIKDKLYPQLLRQYDFQIFHDDAIIAKNMVKTGREKEAIKLLLTALTWQRLKTGLGKPMNYPKLVFSILLMVSIRFGVGKQTIEFLTNIKGYVKHCAQRGGFKWKRA